MQLIIHQLLVTLESQVTQETFYKSQEQVFHALYINISTTHLPCI